jgi:hypothetical protein
MTVQQSLSGVPLQLSVTRPPRGHYDGNERWDIALFLCLHFSVLRNRFVRSLREANKPQLRAKKGHFHRENGPQEFFGVFVSR